MVLVVERADVVPERPRRSGTRVAAGLLTTAAAVGAVAVLPRLVGTGWPEVASALAGVGAGQVAVLVLVWAAGLLVCAGVLTASLAGLSRRRAVLLNLSGSAVASALPFGGAVGVWLNSLMLRRWRFSGQDVASFTITSNGVDLVGKFAVALPALAIALATGGMPRLPHAQGWSIALASSVLAGAVVVVAAGTGRGLRILSGAIAGADRVLVRWPRRASAPRVAGEWFRHLDEVRTTVLARVRAQWSRLTFGVLGYVALQGLLFVLCLRAAGVHTAATAVLAAFALDRVASSVPVTPSGTGMAEAAACAVLIGAGAPAVPVLTGVLLYRFLIVVLEVPVGGIALGGWLLAQRGDRSGDGRGAR